MRVPKKYTHPFPTLASQSYRQIVMFKMKPQDILVNVTKVLLEEVEKTAQLRHYNHIESRRVAVARLDTLLMKTVASVSVCRRSSVAERGSHNP